MTIKTASSSASTTTINNLLDDQGILPSVKESMDERASDVVLRTIQQLSVQMDQLSKELQELKKQSSTESSQLSIKFSLILQKFNTNKQPIIPLCPPPPPLPPCSIINLKNQENGKASTEQKQKESASSSSTNCTDKLETQDPPKTKMSKQIKDHAKKMRLKWAENNKTTGNLTLQKETNLRRSKSMYVKGNNKKEENPEVEETLSVAARIERFKGLSQNPN